MNKKFLGLVLVLLLGSQSLSALTRAQVWQRASITAGLVSGAAYGLSFCPCFHIKSPLTISAATFVGTLPLCAWISSYYTADARYEWAQKQFKKLEKHYLYCVRITELNFDEVLRDSGCESSEFPLVTAFLLLQSYDRTLELMAEELKKAIRDADNEILCTQLRELLEKVRINLPRIRNNEAIIKGHDRAAWIEQWKLHQRRELEKEKIRNQYFANLTPQTQVVYQIGG